MPIPRVVDVNAFEHALHAALDEKAWKDLEDGDEGPADDDHHVRPDDVERVEGGRDLINIGCYGNFITTHITMVLVESY